MLLVVPGRSPFLHGHGTEDSKLWIGRKVVWDLEGI